MFVPRPKLVLSLSFKWLSALFNSMVISVIIEMSIIKRVVVVVTVVVVVVVDVAIVVVPNLSSVVLAIVICSD